MPEKVVPGPVSDDRSIREAVCIHTKKILIHAGIRTASKI